MSASPDERTGLLPGARHDRRRRRPGRWVALVLVVLLIAAAGGGYGIYRQLQGNITSASVAGRTGPEPTASSTAPPGVENILLIGSDTRANPDDLAAAGGYSTPGARSDTTILLHLSADRSRAIAVSIPRDSWVPIPSCTDATGASTPAVTGTKFNEAYSKGGAACTIATVQTLTQVKIDHYVVVDFSGFKTMVDALGGVPVCLTKAANDRKSGLNLPAGEQTVTGDQALAFVRARYTLGDGSDLGRIERQQAFLSGLVQKSTSAGTLVDLPKLYSFLNAATKSITTDPELASVSALASTARSVKSIKESNISFVTVPTQDRGDGANVVWTPDAATLWDIIRNDQPLPGSPGATSTPAPSASSEPDASAPAPSATTAPLTVAPSGVQVQVLNATITSGLAAQVAAALRAQGFVVTGTGDAPATGHTVVQFPTGTDEAARTLAAAVPGSTATTTGAAGTVLTLVVGSDYTTVAPVSVGSVASPPSPSISSRSADQSLCT